MIIFTSAEKLKNHLIALRKSGKIIGFVPTMGALHQGHVSLITAAKGQCDVVVCSIFVNPTQFNDLTDLEKYPRTPQEDEALLVSAGCDVLFAPEVSEVYAPEELLLKKNHVEDKSWMEGKTVDFGLLEKVMEGAQRPGHFNGVAQVVSKLFRITAPDKAFFGQKDFQQLTIIKSMVRQLEMPVEIIACPIVREEDGLAMSSRNRRLTEKERIWSNKISTMLQLVRNMKLYMVGNIEELRDMVKIQIESQGVMKLEYFEIVDPETLQPVKDLKTATGAVACIAVKLSSVRLIDNLELL